MDRLDAEYHRGRAQQEIDRALAARNLLVARAHFGLARLHAERLQGLENGAGRPLIRM